MALRVILTGEDPTLHKVCRPVTEFDQRLATLLDDMRETLERSNGVGLAAPQVGILRRVVLVLDAQEQPMELVNPVIVDSSGEQTGLEGCLSVPGRYGTVTRPSWVKVRAQDRQGRFFEMEGEEIVARCFCHEIDHLDGHVFTEHVVGPLYTAQELDEIMAEGEK